MLARLTSGLDGASGYLIRDLESGEMFAKDGDAVFPAASTIKLPVFLELYKRAEEGTIDLSQPVLLHALGPCPRDYLVGDGHQAAAQKKAHENGADHRCGPYLHKNTHDLDLSLAIIIESKTDQ